MASSALADKINGQFICSQIFSDGSKGTLIVVVEDTSVKIKKLGGLSTQYTHYKLIHVGKKREFKAFVGDLLENIVTITFDPEPVNGEYHFSEIGKTYGGGPKGRLRYGKCDKI